MCDRNSRWLASSKRLLIAASAAFVLLYGMIGNVGPAAARDETLTKAQFLHNLALYIEWPDSSFRSSSAPFRFCTVGSGDVASALMWVGTGKKIRGRSIDVTEISSPSQAGSCQLVFLSGDSQAQLRDYVTGLSGEGVLTVSDTEKFAELGGVIGFKMVREKIQFTINSVAVGREKLKVNDKLMKLGDVI